MLVPMGAHRQESSASAPGGGFTRHDIVAYRRTSTVATWQLVRPLVREGAAVCNQ